MKKKNIEKNKNFIVLSTDFTSMEFISDFIQQKAQESNLSFKKAWELILAIDELCFNTIVHTPSEEDNKIKIIWKDYKKYVVIHLLDNGHPFNPLSIPPGEIRILEEGKRLGGMGPYLIEKMVDEVSYKRENGYNCLIIKKYKKKTKLNQH